MARTSGGPKLSRYLRGPDGLNFPADLPAALKKHAVSALPDCRSKHHTPAHVAAFVLDPTNFIIEEGESSACINVQALHFVIILKKAIFMLDLEGMAAYFSVQDGSQNASKPLWHFRNCLPPCDCTHAGIFGTPYVLTTKHKEEVLMLVVRLNGGRGDCSVIAAVSKELIELDMGDWHKSADVARHH